MIRVVLILLAFIAAAPATMAQQGDGGSVLSGADPDARAVSPVLRVDFPETDTIPGQSLSLRLTVLVPTFMPAPPVWPTLETPDLLIRLPERSTSPTSERIDGETWSGVTRRYLLAPMVAAEFAIPPQEIVVSWDDPAANGVIESLLMTPEIRFRGTLPAGAEGLDPFVGAIALELTEEIEGDTGVLAPGDSFTRSVMARVDGVSPMFLPPLLSLTDIPGLAAYPDDALIVEKSERGSISGTRTESVTYVAEGGGGGTLPSVALDWFDIEAGEVRSATIDSVEVQIDGPPVAQSAPRDWRLVALWAMAVLLALVVLVAVCRRVVPAFRRIAVHRRQKYQASERFAWRRLQQVIADRDETAMRPALDLWASRVDAPDPRRDSDVSSALLSLGAQRYGRVAATPAKDSWDQLSDALSKARTGMRTSAPRGVLPELNPD